MLAAELVDEVGADDCCDDCTVDGGLSDPGQGLRLGPCLWM